MKKILIFSSEFPPGPGGIGTHAFQLAKHLTKNGSSVEIITSQNYVQEEAVKRFNESQPFKIIRLKDRACSIREAFYRARILKKSIKEFNPDIILATGNRSVWLTAFVLRHKSIPWAAMGHGGEFGVKRPLEKFLTRWAFGKADQIICVSTYTQNKMRDLGIRAQSETVIANGINPGDFKSLTDQEILNTRMSLGAKPSDILLTVGSVTERKGQDLVIRALPEILKKYPQTHYVMIGFPKKKDEYEQLAKQLGVDQRTHFLGIQDHTALNSWLNASDLFVLTSRHSSEGDFEGYGIAVIEAAACGKPAIVSKNSGLQEAIIEGQTGVSVPENDPDAVAQAVIDLLDNPAKRLEMGSYAQKRAAQETWEIKIRKYENFLFRLINNS